MIAFRDIDPQAPTHILLIPKEHVESVADARATTTASMLADIIQAADASRADARASPRAGWRLVTNVGPDAGQAVFHLHFHLLGGRAMGWPPG